MRKPPRNLWSLGGAGAIQVGRVAVSVLDGNLARARAVFTVPELPAETYHLMLCDAACTEPLANVIPARFTVVADPATARMARRLDRLEQRIRRQAGPLATARADADRARVTARNAHSDVQQLEGRVSSLADDGRRLPVGAWWAYAGWLVAGALMGALALLILRGRRSRPPRPAQLADRDPGDELEVRLLDGAARVDADHAHRVVAGADVAVTSTGGDQYEVSRGHR